MSAARSSARSDHFEHVSKGVGTMMARASAGPPVRGVDGADDRDTDALGIDWLDVRSHRIEYRSQAPS